MRDTFTFVPLASVLTSCLPQPQVLLKYTGYTKDEIYGCAKVVASKISEMRVTATNRSLVAVKKKYDNEHLHFVSTEFDPPSAEDLA